MVRRSGSIVIAISAFWVGLLISNPLLAESEGEIDVQHSDTISYMYLYCRRSMSNPFCEKRFAKQYYINSLMRSKKETGAYRDPVSSEPRLEDTHFSWLIEPDELTAQTLEEKPTEENPRTYTTPTPSSSESTPSKPVIVESVRQRPTTHPIKSNAQENVPENTPEQIKPKPPSPAEHAEPPVQVTTNTYLLDWIKHTYGVDLNGEHLSAAELAEIYTRLMWCSNIENEFNQSCDYKNSTSEELRQRYESLKNPH